MAASLSVSLWFRICESSPKLSKIPATTKHYQKTFLMKQLLRSTNSRFKTQTLKSWSTSYFLNVLNGISRTENYRKKLSNNQRKNWIRECNFSLYFLLKSTNWNHSSGHGSRHEVSEWMKIYNLLRIRYRLTTSKKKYISWASHDIHDIRVENFGSLQESTFMVLG